MAQAQDSLRVVVVIRHVHTRRQHAFVHDALNIVDIIEILQGWEEQNAFYELDYFYFWNLDNIVA